MTNMMINDDRMHHHNQFPIIISESFWFKLLPVTGTSWILVYFSILDNFAFWVGSEKCLENGVLIFFGSQCKIQGKIKAKINFGHNF